MAQGNHKLTTSSIRRVQQALRIRTRLEEKRNNRRLFQEANRLKRLPLYLFTILDELKAQASARGIDVIDLGMGNPDLPPPKHVVKTLVEQAKKPENHRYSRKGGDVECKLNESIAEWYQRKFGVTLDPKSEVLPLIGSKEGISHLSLAFLNHDDIALVPNPTYPVHFNGVVMAGGVLYSLPIHQENRYLPDLHSIPRSVLKQSKMLFLSYPHNPTTAVADVKFFKEATAWARSHRIMIVHDFAYSDITFDGYRAPSILEVDGAKEVAVEFHTLSKSYSLPGLRLGFAVGNPDVLASLAKTKSYIDFGIFRAVQWAAIDALMGPQEYVTNAVELYHKRRNMFLGGLKRIGWELPLPPATFYVWAKIPMKFSALTSLEFATLLVQEAGVVISPGSGFGEYGEGFVRFALVEPESRLDEAIERIGNLLRMKD